METNFTSDFCLLSSHFCLLYSVFSLKFFDTFADRIARYKIEGELSALKLIIKGR